MTSFILDSEREFFNSILMSEMASFKAILMVSMSFALIDARDFMVIPSWIKPRLVISVR